MIRTVVLVSGGGTNLQRLLDLERSGDLAPAQIVAVIASNSKAYALERARLAGVPTAVLAQRDYADEAAWDQALLASLEAYRADLIVLGGFLKKIGPRVLAAYSGRILNIHPSLLPKYGGPGLYGLAPHQAVLAAGERETGATVHLVTADYDRGPILLQRKVAVLPGDSPEELQQRVMREAEQVILPQAVQALAAQMEEGADEQTSFTERIE